MVHMVCKECQQLLSDYIDGLLELGEQSQLEGHLADCEPCRAVRDDLLQIVHFSHQLPELAPSAALWTRIEGELARVEPVSATARLGRWWARLREQHFNLSLPQLAASAAALVIVLSVGIIAFRHDSGAVNISELRAPNLAIPDNFSRLSMAELDSLKQQVDQLSARIDGKKSEWNPELRDVYERNLLYVNESLAECQHSLSNNPTDDTAQELMLNAYREKMRLLEGFRNF